jgi:hypothetical protein
MDTPPLLHTVNAVDLFLLCILYGLVRILLNPPHRR